MMVIERIISTTIQYILTDKEEGTVDQKMLGWPERGWPTGCSICYNT
jgi:hypothetical protein